MNRSSDRRAATAQKSTFSPACSFVVYESDPEVIRQAVPEPLQPDGSGRVLYEWITMPDSSGFGSYSESGVVIPCLLDGDPVNYTAQMYLNDEPPIDEYGAALR